MTNRLRALIIVLLAISFIATLSLRGNGSAAQRKPPQRRCTKAALAALKPAPALDYECTDDQDDNFKSVERQAAMKDYLRQLEETFNDDAWWATTVEDLNACAIAKEVRPLNESENRNYYYSIYLYGDNTTRVLAVIDPCIKYSYATLDVYILQRAGHRVVATQILDAFYTRLDASLFMEVAQLNGERVIRVDRYAHDGGPTTTEVTTAAYTINPRTHRPVAKKIFKQGRKLTNEIVWEMPPFFYLGNTLPDEGWQSPEIVRHHRLASRFYIYYPTKRGVRRHAYVWTNTYYQSAR
jgi:hypothetical protein